MPGTEPINTCGALCTSGSTIIALIAIAIALIVFGVPLYMVRKRNKVAIESGEPDNDSSFTAEVTPVNDAGPQPAQQPVLTSGPISVGTSVPEPKPSRKRRAPGARIEPKKETKRTPKKPAEKETPAKTRKKNDETESVSSKEFASKHDLRISDMETKTVKKTTGAKKTTKKK